MILAIDPGSDKTGLAILDKNKEIYLQKIVATVKLESYLKELLNSYQIEGFVLGDGTASREIEEILQENYSLPVTIVDESYTTMEAEERFRRDKERGFLRLLRFIKWKPSVPLDDYVAVILAERYLDGN